MKRIICYGESLIDFTYDGQAFIPHPGGSPYNVAIALGRLGTQVDYCTQLSTDMFGNMLLQHLELNHVGTTTISRNPAPSTLAFVLTHPETEPEYAFYSRQAADVIIQSEDLPAPIEATLHHFGSISLMQEPCGTTWENYLTQLDGFISFDPNIRPSLIPDRQVYLDRFNRITGRIQLLRLSLSDLQWLAPDEAVEHFVDRMFAKGILMVAITSGSDGAWIYTLECNKYQPVMSVSVTDTIGAGDTFTAGLLSVLVDGIKDKTLAKLDNNMLARALKTGSIAAALNCRNKGANPPTADEVNKLM
ncbi:carbohydrate kinase family protein [Yersinia hibernica]|uniref:Carbohydrate kinase n=1 Tax=Yersinia enterocolitica LC20 TaxID=1443113 RepID=A0A7U4JZJ6_YEREN|nr:carbohydrate kinase [Yersinia hibernica]AHM71352.1 carbohydrate kinase [Yersinia hibernica]OVZ83513.1 carbohydrate kinase [Yersinia kristensenii]